MTAIGGGGHGEQILKALLRADRYRVIGADADPRTPQFGLVAKGCRLPRADDPSYMDAVLDVCSHFGVSAVFHGCESDLRVLSSHRDRLRDAGILFPANPPNVIAIGMDKGRTMRFLEENGFDSPRTLMLNGSIDHWDIDWFPVVVKPSVEGGGSRDVYLAQDARDLEIVQEYLLAQGASEMIVQEYVGTPDAEYTVGVLHDLDGQYLNSIAVRRSLSGGLNIKTSVPNRTTRTELGPRLVISSGISHGHVGRYPEITATCAKIAAALGVKGPLNIQCRVVEDRVFVFEINPRFSGTTSLRAIMGYNEPDVLLRKHLLGEEIPREFEYRSGWIMRSLVETEVTVNAPWWHEVT